MNNRDGILFLPKSMSERALWARQHFINHPEESQIDDNSLIWCLNSEDGLWYSILGNYSYSSPQEKRDREFARQELESEIKKQMEEFWKNYYQKIIYSSEIRNRVLTRDDFTCQLCRKKGKTKLHIHHILKVKEGGTDYLDNLITVCPSCHKKADTKFYNPEWGEGR